MKQDLAYLQDILAQPEALDATHRALEKSFDLGSLPKDLQAGKYQRLILTGMGSSHFVFYPLFYHLLAKGLAPVLMESAELIHYAPNLIQHDSLVIAASQSGRSAETVRLLELTSQVGATVMGITNTPDSPLGLQSNSCVMTDAGEEATVSCKTYVAALSALRWVQDALLNEDLIQARADTAAIGEQVRTYLEHWQDHVTYLQQALDRTSNLFMVGRGPSLAAVQTGCLTMKESTHFHGEGMSSAAFRHGPMEMAGPGTYIMIMAGEVQTRALNANLATTLQEAGAKTAWVGEDAEIAAYRLPGVPASMRPVVEILPTEMLNLALAERLGHAAGVFERGSKVTILE